jgi:hypothetical protein
LSRLRRPSRGALVGGLCRRLLCGLFLGLLLGALCGERGFDLGRLLLRLRLGRVAVIGAERTAIGSGAAG